MKKIIFAVFFILIITAGVHSQNGTIREFTGEVELKHAGSASFVAASVGATVASNTIISTSFKSTAVIAIGSSVITVSPLTRLTLAEIQSAGNTESVNVNLQAGRVRVDVKPPAGTRANFTVQSPSATASVRGTTFEMDSQNLFVNEGTVIVSGNTGPAVIVVGGNSTFSNAEGGPPADPVEVAAGSLAPPAPVGSPAPETVSHSAETETGPTLISPRIKFAK